MQINRMSHNLNNYQVNNRSEKSQNVSFSGVTMPTNSKIFKPVNKFFKPVSDFYEKGTTKLAHGFASLLETKTVENIIKKTQDMNLVPHLTVVSSIILSGMYIKKTLGNDQLDEQKRRTLAINQAAVWGASTVMGYTFNKYADKRVDKFIDKFKAVNAHDEKLLKYVNGIKIAKAIMIFDVVYRFVTPVLVTPFANKIGNRIQEKKDAERANQQNQLSMSKESVK